MLRLTLMFPTIAATVALSFATDIKPILDYNCSECHHAGKSLDLSVFPFNGGADQEAIVAAIIAMTSSGRMPLQPRTRLSNDQIEMIKAWQSGGLAP